MGVLLIFAVICFHLFCHVASQECSTAKLADTDVLETVQIYSNEYALEDDHVAYEICTSAPSNSFDQVSDSARFLTNNQSACPSTCTITLNRYTDTFQGNSSTALYFDIEYSYYLPNHYVKDNKTSFLCVMNNGSCGATVPVYRYYKISNQGVYHAYSFDQDVVYDGYNQEFMPICYAWTVPTGAVASRPACGTLTFDTPLSALSDLRVYDNNVDGIERDHYYTTLPTTDPSLIGYNETGVLGKVLTSPKSTACSCLVKLQQQFDNQTGYFHRLDHKLVVTGMEPNRPYEEYHDTGETVFCAKRLGDCGATLPLWKHFQFYDIDTVYTTDSLPLPMSYLYPQTPLCYIWASNYSPNVSNIPAAPPTAPPLESSTISTASTAGGTPGTGGTTGTTAGTLGTTTSGPTGSTSGTTGTTASTVSVWGTSGATGSTAETAGTTGTTASTISVWGTSGATGSTAGTAGTAGTTGTTASTISVWGTSGATGSTAGTAGTAGTTGTTASTISVWGTMGTSSGTGGTPGTTATSSPLSTGTGGTLATATASASTISGTPGTTPSTVSTSGVTAPALSGGTFGTGTVPASTGTPTISSMSITTPRPLSDGGITPGLIIPVPVPTMNPSLETVPIEVAESNDPTESPMDVDETFTLSDFLHLTTTTQHPPAAGTVSMITGGNVSPTVAAAPPAVTSLPGIIGLTGATGAPGTTGAPGSSGVPVTSGATGTTVTPGDSVTSGVSEASGPTETPGTPAPTPPPMITVTGSLFGSLNIPTVPPTTAQPPGSSPASVADVGTTVTSASGATVPPPVASTVATSIPLSRSTVASLPVETPLPLTGSTVTSSELTSLAPSVPAITTVTPMVQHNVNSIMGGPLSQFTNPPIIQALISSGSATTSAPIPSPSPTPETSEPVKREIEYQQPLQQVSQATTESPGIIWKAGDWISSTWHSVFGGNDAPALNSTASESTTTPRPIGGLVGSLIGEAANSSTENFNIHSPGFLNNTKNWLDDKVNSTGEFLSNAWNSMSTTNNNNATAGSDNFINGSKTWVNGAMNSTGEFLTNAWNSLGSESNSTFVNGTKTWVNGAVNSTGEFLSNAWNSIGSNDTKTWVNGAMNSTGEFLSNAWNSMSNNNNSSAESNNDTGTWVNGTKTWVNGAVNSTGEFLSNAWNPIGSNDTKAWINGAVNSTGEFLSNAWSETKEQISGQLNGTNLVEGAKDLIGLKPTGDPGTVLNSTVEPPKIEWNGGVVSGPLTG